jgi:hypothetical protein
MWMAEDKKIAEHAAQTLGRLQNKTGPEVLRELKDICGQVANKRTDEHERAEAWLSICRLIERLEESPNAANIPGLWHRAIQAANAWRGSMR